MSRQVAQRQIRSGSVLVDGVAADKPARLVDGRQELTLVGERERFVSRAGRKLEAALDVFEVDVQGLRCLDAGSSTGGFTDCLLQRGAASVVAVDVGTDQLHRRIRGDRRVIVHEQTDIRSVTEELIEGRVDLVVADLSFISLRLVLAPLRNLINDAGQMLVLVKPQFEAGRSDVKKGRGVVRDPVVWRRVLDETVKAASDLALAVLGATVSPITGASGNVEFIVWLQAVGANPNASLADDHGTMLDDVVAAAEARGM